MDERKNRKIMPNQSSAYTRPASPRLYAILRSPQVKQCTDGASVTVNASPPESTLRLDLTECW